MRKRMYIAALMMGSGLLWTGTYAGEARAQMDGMKAQAGQAPGGQTEPGKAYDSLLSLFEGEMMGVVKAMPAEKYDFNPASLGIAGAKYDGVRSFGEEAKHVAQANYSFYSGVGGMKPDVDVKAIGTLKTKDEIVAALAASFAYAHKAVGMLTAQNVGDTVKGPGVQTRGTMAAFGIAHGFDHYGQMVEYLRMNGIVPPGSK